jgi:hypothetical protein
MMTKTMLDCHPWEDNSGELENFLLLSWRIKIDSDVLPNAKLAHLVHFHNFFFLIKKL